MPFEAGMKIEFVPTRTIMDLTAVPRLMLEKLIISFAENEIIPKYKAITDSFDTHHPEFGIIESNVSANLVSMWVYVTDDDEKSSDGAIFRYLDEGTSIRKALMSSDWISKTRNNLSNIIYRYRFKSLNIPGRLKFSLEEHRAIMESLKEHNSAEADKLSRLHMENTIINILRNVI